MSEPIYLKRLFQAYYTQQSSKIPKVHLHDKREFGFIIENRNILVDNIRVRAAASLPSISDPEIAAQTGRPVPVKSARCYFEQGWTEPPIYYLEELGSGAHIIGPALIINDTTTIVLEPDTNGTISTTGDILITLEDQT